jgi:CspA family cold shock protein
MQGSGDGATVRATVKWFNTAKGFGFVTPVDGSPEAFLHLSALKQAGFDTVGEGTGMLVEIGQSPKGRQVVRVIQIDAEANRAPSPGGGGRPRGPVGGGGGGVGAGGGPGPSAADIANAETVDGIVKWFSALKGYGFVSPNTGGKDVFLHITVLRNLGLTNLSPGQPVRMRVVTARKGPEAVAIELTGAAPPQGPGDDPR